MILFRHRLGKLLNTIVCSIALYGFIFLLLLAVSFFNHQNFHDLIVLLLLISILHLWFLVFHHFSAWQEETRMAHHLVIGKQISQHEAEAVIVTVEPDERTYLYQWSAEDIRRYLNNTRQEPQLTIQSS